MSGTSNHRIGSTVDLEIDSIDAHGFTIPQYMSSEVVFQDDPDDVTSSSYIREFTADSNELIAVEIGCHQSGTDLDMYLYRDKNSNGVIDWGNEQVGSSGNFNCDESIEYGGGQADTYWVVVHGYDLRASNTTFWLRWSEIGGNDLGIIGFSELNQTQILSNYTNGSAALGGAMPTRVIELNLTWNRPTEAGVWGGFVDLTLDSGGLIRLPYSFVLIDPAPEISFSLPNGTRTNQTLDISMHSYDQGTGFNISGMTFDVDSQWPGAPIPFSATLETITIEGQHSSDNLGLWDHWNTHRIFSEGDHFAASSNSLTLEAESAMNILAGEGPEWSFSNSNSDYSGTGYMTTAYDGFDSLNQSSGAHLSWDVEFDSTGVYWVWVRLNQHSEQANAIHVGMDGILQTIGDEGLSVNGTGWTWSNSVYGQNISTPVGLNVTAPGRHTVDIWVKESGVDFDRLELTTSPTWIPPTGNASNYSAAAIRWNDLTLRSAWLNWSLPSDNRWHEYSGET